MNNSQQFETDVIRYQALTAEASKHISKFLQSSTDGLNPLQLLHDLLVHDSDGMSDGTHVMTMLLEDLMRFFMQPDNAAAFQSSALTSPPKMASILVQMHWVFQQMDRPVAMGHLDNFYVQHYADDKEIASITHKYKELVEIEEATTIISAKYK